jgi:hypothetical protein
VGDTQTMAAWLGNERAGRGGAPTTYTDTAIHCLLTLKAVFHLPLRQTQALAPSMLTVLGVTLPAPTSSTLSCRAATLMLPRLRTTKRRHLHLVIDASGLKIYGDGEWRVKQHGWTKLHLGVECGVKSDDAARDARELQGRMSGVGEETSRGGFSRCDALFRIVQQSAGFQLLVLEW